MYPWIRHAFPHLPAGVAIAAAVGWYSLLIFLAIVGVFEPQAEFQYLAM